MAGITATQIRTTFTGITLPENGLDRSNPTEPYGARKRKDGVETPR